MKKIIKSIFIFLILVISIFNIFYPKHIKVKEYSEFLIVSFDSSKRPSIGVMKQDLHERYSLVQSNDRSTISSIEDIEYKLLLEKYQNQLISEKDNIPPFITFKYSLKKITDSPYQSIVSLAIRRKGIAYEIYKYKIFNGVITPMNILHINYPFIEFIIIIDIILFYLIIAFPKWLSWFS